MEKNEFQPRGIVHGIVHNDYQEPVEPKRKFTKSPMDNKFRIIIKSKPDLSEQFIRASLNLSQDFIEIDAIENYKWEVLDWLLSIKNDGHVEGGESITVLSFDEEKKGKILCMLELLGLRLINHECTFAKQTIGPLGASDTSSETLYHDIRISFEKCERVRETVTA